jgi:hypothetical protein
MAAVLAASGCGGEKEPSPGDAEDYDIVIAFCERRLDSTQDMCDRVSETAGDEIFANVLLGRAGGHELVVQTEVTDGGSLVEESPPDQIPQDSSWLHVVQIPRSQACAEPSCEITVRVILDGTEAANEEFAFTD